MCGPERYSDASTFSPKFKREESVCVSGVLVACGTVGVRYVCGSVSAHALLPQVRVYIRHDTRAKP